MREFIVTCTTCHAPLKVRDASLLGQIVACPKCGSMVLIEPPTVGDAKSPTAASQATRPGPTPTFDDADVEAALGQRDSHPSAASAEAVATPEPSVSGLHVQPATPPTSAVPDDSNTGQDSVGAEDNAASSNRTREILLSVAAGVAGLVLAIGLALAAIAVFSGPDEQARKSAAPSPMTGGTDVADVGNSPTDSRSPGATPNSVSSSPPNSAGQVHPPIAAPDRTSTPPTATKTSPTDKAVAASDGGEKLEKPHGQPPTVPDKAVPEKPASDNPAAAGKDVATVPSANSGSPEKPAQPPAGRPDPAGPPAFAPKPLGERVTPAPIAGDFSRLLPGAFPQGEKPTESATPAKIPPADTPAPEIPIPSPDGPPSSPEISRPRPREIDIQARLADPIVQLEFPSIPLSDFVQLLSDLSTVPMTLDADALRVRRIDPSTPINVKVQDSTVREALVAAVQPLKLGLVIHDNAVVVSHPVGGEAARRTVSHDLTDLDRGDETEREWLTQTITELISPDQWADAGGPNELRWENGKLSVEADEAVHFEILLLCDKLRTARKLAPRGKYAPALLAVDSVAARAGKSMATKITLNFNRPTRISEITNRFGKAAGLRILMDWHELTDAGWTVETTATLSVEDLALGQSLDKLLAPRELTYRVIDDSTLQITTTAVADQRHDVELHSAGGVLKADGDPQALLERLYDKLGSRRFRAFGGKSVLRYDATSRCVVALLPWRQQVELARALAEWSAPPAP